MSFLQKAREAAEQVANQAKAAGQPAQPGQAGEAAAPGTPPATGWGQPAPADVGHAFAAAGQTAREAVGLARKGISTVVEKIDPATLADLIIKATALQEKTNSALRTKSSPYRIAEIGISASIPPAVTFTIGRIDDPEELAGRAASSTELIAAGATTEEAVISLDGTTADADTIPSA